MVPFQLVIMISSPSAKPYEHEPSPRPRLALVLEEAVSLKPFSPFSSSSRRRKERGSTAPMANKYLLGLVGQYAGIGIKPANHGCTLKILLLWPINSMKTPDKKSKFPSNLDGVI
jgi:hypothetical protein